MPEVSTTPGALDLSVYAGDSNRTVYEFLIEGEPFDLTGATVEAQARLWPADPAVRLSAVVDMSEAAVGRVAVLWHGEHVRALLSGKDSWTGVWDMQLLMSGDSLPVTPLAGRFSAFMDVTRAE